ncbi:MAG: SdpI family protein [Oscillospiraceae bacterium]|nr:SdpI family protein [Oscillospiraceae bacterium]
MKNKLLTKKDLLTGALCLLGAVPGVAFYGKLPEKLPFHWDINNQPDNFAPKWLVVFLMPVFMVVLHLIMCMISNKSGEEKKMPEKITTFVRLIIPFVTIVIETITVLYALEKFKNIGTVAVCMVAFMFIVMGNYLPKTRPNSLFGIRLPWTMKNETVWAKTHRATGWLMVLGGIALIPLAVGEFFIVSVVVLAVMILIPVLYSYILAKKLR